MARITSFSLLCCWEESSNSLFSCNNTKHTDEQKLMSETDVCSIKTRQCTNTNSAWTPKLRHSFYPFAYFKMSFRGEECCYFLYGELTFLLTAEHWEITADFSSLINAGPGLWDPLSHHLSVLDFRPPFSSWFISLPFNPSYSNDQAFIRLLND